MLIVLALLACGDTKDTDPGTDTQVSDTETEAPPPYDELAEPTGDCPDLSVSASTSMESSGEEREFTVVVPEGGAVDAPVVFFFHGLSSPDQTPDPAEYMVEALDMQSLADDEGVIIIAPVAPIWEMYGYEFFMWHLEPDIDSDLVLFDDLRSCVAQQHDVDLTRLHAIGFSGGALFTTRVLGERSGTLASALELSGGVDLTIPTFDEEIPQYTTPDNVDLPVALITGGEEDVWPSTSYAIVDFEDASDVLADYLLEDAHDVVRCQHDAGHDVPRKAWNLTIDWVKHHQMGVVDPFDLSGDDDWCARPTLEE